MTKITTVRNSVVRLCTSLAAYLKKCLMIDTAFMQNPYSEIYFAGWMDVGELYDPDWYCLWLEEKEQLNSEVHKIEQEDRDRTVSHRPAEISLTADTVPVGIYG